MTSHPTQVAGAARVDVHAASGQYSIDIAPGLAPRLDSVLDRVGAPKRRFVVSSATVWRLHGSAVARVTKDDPILIPDGERYKNLQTVGRIYDALVRAGADRAT